MISDMVLHSYVAPTPSLQLELYSSLQAGPTAPQTHITLCLFAWNSTGKPNQIKRTRYLSVYACIERYKENNIF